MKTDEVRVGRTYLYKGQEVTVVERIRGKETNRRNMHSGMLCTGYHHKQKKFLLSNGDIVKAQLLTPLKLN